MLFSKCQNNIHKTVKSLSELRVCHSNWKNQFLFQVSKYDFLVFLLDSRSMHIFLPERKIKKAGMSFQSFIGKIQQQFKNQAKTLDIHDPAFLAVDSN